MAVGVPKALEAIDRNHLIIKLANIGLCKTVLSWFRSSYLSGWSQNIWYRNCISKNVIDDFPQRTVNGNSELADHIHNCNFLGCLKL